MRYQISENEVKWAQEIFALIEKKISAECDRLGSQMPYIPVDGHYQDMGGEHLTWWTNSFWAGILWQMYHAVGDKKYADSAIGLEERLDQALEDYQHLDHDLGFMWSHAAVAILASRFQPAGNYFRAWNTPGESVAIVDCLMNLPLLYWGSRESGNDSWKRLAMAHADTALKEILRPDGSSNHIVKYDTETGEIVEKPGGQGYGEGSSWTRGLAWAIYGMSLSYRYRNPWMRQSARHITLLRLRR